MEFDGGDVVLCSRHYLVWSNKPSNQRKLLIKMVVADSEPKKIAAVGFTAYLL